MFATCVLNVISKVYSDMSRRKLQVVRYKKDHLDVEDDEDFKYFAGWCEECFIKRRDEDWVAELIDEKSPEKLATILEMYLPECGIDPQSSRRVIVDRLLDLAIEKIYQGTNDAHSLTAEVYEREKLRKQQEAVNTMDPLNRIDYGTEDFATKVYQLCRFLGVAEHPDPVISLKASCLFIRNNLSKEHIEERNKEVKKEVHPNFFDLKSFPLGMAEDKDGAVNIAARILRLLNVSALRETQLKVNELLVEIQNMSIDMSKKPNWGQVQYGRS